MSVVAVIMVGVTVLVTVLMTMRIALDVEIAGHDEYAAADAHDFDLRAIETRQGRAGDDLVNRAEHRPARAKVQDAIDRPQKRIELMRAEEDGDF
jgi:hypothetical protein